MSILVTGGAGFIGSAVVRHLLGSGQRVITVDCLTYAGNPDSLSELANTPDHVFERVDIRDEPELRRVFATHRPDAVIHLAAESHVDRSIDGPAAFVSTNVVGTCVLLEVARAWWLEREANGQPPFRFLHVSTDEVFGTLGAEGTFSELSPYAPRSPYAASKAASDHLVRAWGHTYGLPTLIANCSNNYGPRQFPEKLIPLTILNALEGRPLPVYGAGDNVRDWLFVEDHAAALALILEAGKPGSTYAVGGSAELRNIDVVRAICAVLDRRAPKNHPHADLITFVADRPGHDHRYAIDATRLTRELGWRPRHDFDSGLERTVEWYLANRDWWQRIRSGVYAGERLGTIAHGPA